MTSVCAITDGKKIIMAADSQATVGYQKSIRITPKVFKRDGFLFGCAGSFRMIDILQYSFILPKHEPDINVEEYIRNIFINELRDCFKKYGFCKITENVEYFESGGSFLLGYRGRIFSIEADFQVAENIFHYDATGSGAQLILGAFYALKHLKLSQKETLDYVLGAATTFDCGTSPPYHFIYSD